MASVHIEEVRHSEGKEYTAADADGIQFARFIILERDKANKNILIRLKLSRNAGDQELKELLTRIWTAVSRRGEVFKLSLIVSEDINVNPFIRLGFVLEGILQDHEYRDSITKDQYIFGATAVRFGLGPSSRMLELEGERVCLKLATPEAADDFLEYYQRNRDFLSEYEPRKEEHFFTPEGQRRELVAKYSQFLNGSAISFGIYLGESLIGKITLSNIVPGSFLSAILGYALSEDHLNQGYMSESVGLVCRYAFREMGLHRLEASTLLDNDASQHVLRNNGFRLLGLNRQYLRIDGSWRDHYTFYLLQEEWEEAFGNEEEE